MSKDIKKKKALLALAALAQDSRLSVFLLLLEHKKEGLPAGEISDELGIPPTTMSFHLSQLKNAGLVKSKKIGRSIIYRSNKKRAEQLARFVMGKKSDKKSTEEVANDVASPIPNAEKYAL